MTNFGHCPRVTHMSVRDDAQTAANHATIQRLFTNGTMCLAPMVRAGTLPLRMQALQYGADCVYVLRLPHHQTAAELTSSPSCPTANQLL